MSYQNRPSIREIERRLKEAEKAIIEGKVAFANEAKVVGELFQLNIGDTEELWPIILELLGEIKNTDYAGAYPPLKSVEPLIADCELYAFVWDSTKYKKKMYFKFAVKDGVFYYVSLHNSRPPSKGR
jgi:hypothetical protein